MTGTDLMTAEEAREYLGISRITLWRYAKEHPRVLRNHMRGRRRVFERAGVERFARQREELTQL